VASPPQEENLVLGKKTEDGYIIVRSLRDELGNPKVMSFSSLVIALFLRVTLFKQGK